jgi:DNA-binding NarL/FixJ family response regulator
VAGGGPVIKVLVTALSPALRSELRALLEAPTIEVVGAVGRLAARDRRSPDVDVIVVGDAELLSAAAASSTPDRATAIVALADDDRLVATLRTLPIRGWAIVPREAPAAELQAAAVAAAHGLVVLPPFIAARALGPASGPLDLAVGEEPLTQREREVLELLGQGLTNRQIAERLRISEHTAKFHVSAIFGKLDAGSRAEAVARGIRRGLITV